MAMVATTAQPGAGSGVGHGAAVGLVALAGFLWLLIPILALVDGAGGAPVTGVTAPLALAAAVATAGLAGLGYAVLTRQGWGAAAATTLILVVLAHPLTLYMVTAAPVALALVVVLAVLVMAIHRLAEVGDVQAQIGLGLTLCLAPLGGSVTMALVLPVAVGAALADRDGRRDLRAFLSLLLVLLLPLAITLAALELLPRRGVPLTDLLTGLVLWRDVVPALPGLAAGAIATGTITSLPLVGVLAVVLARRPTLGAAMTVVAALLLPTHLELLRQTVATDLPTWLPSAGLLATTVAVCLTERAGVGRRGTLLAFLALATALTWIGPGPASRGAWAEAVSQPFTDLAVAVAAACPGGSTAGCLAVIGFGR